jgi:release factor glutamine methyltransferase
MYNYIKEQRDLSVYEKQQLLKHSLTEEEFLKKGDMPVEYFTGFVDFAGLTLIINQKVLIPRIESEELVDLAFNFFKHCKKNSLRILELGVGSGAISLALINKVHQLNYLNKNWDFNLTELSSPALAVAKNNFQNLLIEKIDKNKVQVQFILSNLLDKINCQQKFDLVLANLPYIPSQEITRLDGSVKDFEPILALDGGETGFDLIATVLDQILKKDVLAKDAHLFFETHQTHNSYFIKNNYPALLNNFKFEYIKDQFNRQRFIRLKKIFS